MPLSDLPLRGFERAIQLAFARVEQTVNVMTRTHQEKAFATTLLAYSGLYREHPVLRALLAEAAAAATRARQRYVGVHDSWLSTVNDVIQEIKKRRPIGAPNLGELRKDPYYRMLQGDEEVLEAYEERHGSHARMLAEFYADLWSLQTPKWIVTASANLGWLKSDEAALMEMRVDDAARQRTRAEWQLKLAEQGTPGVGAWIVSDMAHASDAADHGGRAFMATRWVLGLLRSDATVSEKGPPVPWPDGTVDGAFLAVASFHDWVLTRLDGYRDQDATLARYAQRVSWFEPESLWDLVRRSGDESGSQDEERFKRHLAIYLHDHGFLPIMEAKTEAGRADLVAEHETGAVIVLEAKVVRDTDTSEGTILERLREGVRQALSYGRSWAQPVAHLVVLWAADVEPGKVVGLDDDSGDVLLRLHVIDVRIAPSRSRARLVFGLGEKRISGLLGGGKGSG